MIGAFLDAASRYLLAELAIKGVVITLGVGLIGVLTRRAAAATRHAVLAVGVLVLVLLPVALVMLPDWHVSVPGVAPADAPTQSVDPLRDVHRGASAGAVSPQPAQTVLDGSPNPNGATAPAAVSGMAPTATSPEYGLGRRVRMAALIVYGLGVVVVVVVVGRSTVRIAMITRYGSTPAEGRERNWAEQHARALGLRRRPRVLVTHWTHVPVTWGVVRPVILLPPGLEFWSEARSRVAVGHELEHIRRFDYLWQLLADAAVAIHWINPLVWVIRRRLHADQEQACDDAVLRGGVPRTDYAQHLVDIARTSVPGFLAAARMATRAPELSARVDSILDRSSNHGPLSRTPVMVAGLLVLTVGTGIAGASFARPPAVPRSLTDVWSLAEHRSPAAFRALVAQLKDPSAQRRGVAALSLGQRRDAAAIDPLIDALGDPDPYVRENAAAALVELGGSELTVHVLPLTSDSVTSVRSVVTWVLGQLGGADAADALFHLVRAEPDEHTRTMAAMAVTHIDDVDIAPRLMALVEEVRGTTRLDVVMALGMTGDPRGLPILVDLLAHDADPTVRRVAVHALADIDDPRRVSAWIDATEDDDWRVRNAAVVLLAGESGSPARRALFEALDDPQHQVRLNAVWALEGIIN